MPKPLSVFERWSVSQIETHLDALDKIERQIVKASDAWTEADAALRDYFVREVHRAQAELTGARAKRASNKAVRMWNRFVAGLPVEIRQEYIHADDSTGFREIQTDLELAHKDLTRARTTASWLENELAVAAEQQRVAVEEYNQDVEKPTKPCAFDYCGGQGLININDPDDELCGYCSMIDYGITAHERD